MRYSEKQGLSSSPEAEKSRHQLLPPSKEQGTGVLPSLGQPGASTQVSETGAITANRNSFQLQGLRHPACSSSRKTYSSLCWWQGCYPHPGWQQQASSQTSPAWVLLRALCLSYFCLVSQADSLEAFATQSGSGNLLRMQNQNLPDP